LSIEAAQCLLYTVHLRLPMPCHAIDLTRGSM
jgi:hypothetical protein